ncbi:MAG: sigma factor-like helix-turn-helix DNA-binding protein [Planctomycetota bacterium]
MAEQLGKSEGAVRVTLHRALAKLSSHLGER